MTRYRYRISPYNGGWAIEQAVADRTTWHTVKWCFTRRGARSWVKQALKDDAIEPEIWE